MDPALGLARRLARTVHDQRVLAAVAAVPRHRFVPHAERARAYEAVGVSRLYLQHLLHRDLEAVELIGRELVPAVA